MNTDRPLRMQAVLAAALFLFYVVVAACAEDTVSVASTEVGFRSGATVAMPLAESKPTP